MFCKSFRIDSGYILVARVDQICIVCFGTPTIYHGEGWGSSIVKVLGDVPSARVHFFGLLVWPRVYFLAILVRARHREHRNNWPT